MKAEQKELTIESFTSFTMKMAIRAAKVTEDEWIEGSYERRIGAKMFFSKHLEIYAEERVREEKVKLLTNLIDELEVKYNAREYDVRNSGLGIAINKLWEELSKLKGE